jgi:hypothetical protein
MSTEIKLVQKPVIQHKLIEVGTGVTKRIEELDIENLVATDDTIKSLKNLRAELNKEFTEFESKRKALKEAVAKPYMEFESVYKDEISEKYKNAVNILKDKIAAFENKVKQEKKESVELYFNELCADAKIDFLKFSDTGIDVNLSTSEKKYKEECQSFVGRVQDDVLLIETVDYPAETLTEYKSSGLNASKAIKTVYDRKEAERLEKERIKADETARRVKMLQGLAFISHEMTRTYNWISDDSVNIEMKDVETLSKEDFNKRYVELEREVKERTKKEEPAPEEKPKQPEVLQAPKVEEPVQKEKTYKASFECEGTMAQLKALGQYMKDNNIKYKNL